MGRYRWERRREAHFAERRIAKEATEAGTLREAERARVMRLNARGDQIIIRPVRRVEATRGTIILPEVAPEKSQRGFVLAVGPRCDAVRAGDEVLFERWGGVFFGFDGTPLLRCAEGDVLAVVERPAGQSPDTANIWLRLDAVTVDRERWRLL